MMTQQNFGYLLSFAWINIINESCVDRLRNKKLSYNKSKLYF